MPSLLMHGGEVGLFTHYETGFLRSRCAESRAGQAEPWWPDTWLLCPMSRRSTNSNDFGANESDLLIHCRLDNKEA